MAGDKTSTQNISENAVKPKKALHFFRRILFTVVLLVATVIVGIIALFFILHFASDSNNYMVTRAENDSLREIATEIENNPLTGSEDGTFTERAPFDTEMIRINPDYICWINIGGTRIDHPVVRGYDNDKYISTSFYGEDNELGAIFIDHRNRGERLSNIIIYGHNSAQGEMFGDLHLLLNDTVLSDNNIITLNVNDKIFEYEIFSVRLTDVYDPAYIINFDSQNDFNEFAYVIDAPAEATKILTLSTCVSRGHLDERLVVHAYSLSRECFLS